jgi:hypothetical protein
VAFEDGDDFGSIHHRQGGSIQGSTGFRRSNSLRRGPAIESQSAGYDPAELWHPSVERQRRVKELLAVDGCKLIVEIF